MGILLAFAPFIAFAVIDRLIGPVSGLFVGALVSAALVLRDVVRPGRVPKILEMGSALLFGGLTLLTALIGIQMSVIGVRLCVDAGLRNAGRRNLPMQLLMNSACFTSRKYHGCARYLWNIFGRKAR